MAKKYRVKITRHAEADAEAIYDYIKRDASEAAAAFVAEPERQIFSLARFPLRCPAIPEGEDVGGTYRHMLYGEYRTILRVDGSTVYILRVLHGARLLGLSILE